jgi:hypothetical protein
MNKSAREVARSLHRYFDDALDFHRNGQEARLFPALLAQVHDADVLPVLVTTLKNEHRALENAWETLGASLTAIALCRPVKLSIDEATGFAAMYRHHVVTEARHLLAFGSTAPHLGEWTSNGSLFNFGICARKRPPKKSALQTWRRQNASSITPPSGKPPIT